MRASDREEGCLCLPRIDAVAHHSLIKDHTHGGDAWSDIAVRLSGTPDEKAYLPLPVLSGYGPTNDLPDLIACSAARGRGHSSSLREQLDQPTR
jgi:hypothetical protein